MKKGKHIILYDTTTGEILGSRSNPPPIVTVNSGTCRVDGNIISGLDLAGHSQDDILALIVTDRRYFISRWINGTSVEIYAKTIVQGIQPYSLIKEGSFVQFTAQQKTDIVDEYKTITDNPNIDALLITSGPIPSSSDFRVDLITRKLVRKDDFVYED
jgi:hypothetical protein